MLTTAYSRIAAGQPDIFQANGRFLKSYSLKPYHLTIDLPDRHRQRQASVGF